MTKHPTLDDSHKTPIDLPSLLHGGALITATSGGGKTWAARRVLEQTFGRGPLHIVFDPEGELHTLREKFDYVLAGPGGDCPATIDTAPVLARRILEHGFSCVIDLYELGARRADYVKAFLEAVMLAPKDLWQEVLVLIEEAHLFCPERGEAPASSESAVKDFMSRGRKRGFRAILSTQRLAAVNNAAAAMCQNALVGLTTLDADQDRAAKRLGFRARGQQEWREQLANLEPGHFFAIGPAFGARAVTEVVVGEVQTTHQRGGKQRSRPIPPRAATMKVLGKLQDIQHQAEEEANELETLRGKVADLKRQLAAKPGVPAAPKPKVVERSVVKPADVKRVEAAIVRGEKVAVGLTEAAKRIAASATVLRMALNGAATTAEYPPGWGGVPSAAVALVGTPRHVYPSRHAAVVYDKTPTVPLPDGVSSAEMKILQACAWMEAIGQRQADVVAVAFLAGYTVNGHFNNLRGKLRTAGLIEYPSGGTVALTDAGRAATPAADTPKTRAALHDAVRARLDTALRRLLDPLLAEYPNQLTSEQLAEAAGYTINGHFNNLRGKLRTLGLAEYPSKNHVRAAAVLFPAGLS